MPAAQKINSVKKLGLIAGGGMLPQLLIDQCHKNGIDVYIIGFKGQTDAELMHRAPHQWAALGAVSTIFEAFRSNGIQDLVLIGRIRRPHLREIRPDFKAAKILAKIGFRALGDSSLLSALRKELEAEGFMLHGMHEFCPELLAQEKTYSRNTPDTEQEKDIQIGIKESQKIGEMDIGQSVVVHHGTILGVEGREGTDELIKRCAAKQGNAKGPILVKTCKPQQDRALDMPTIGPDTIKTAHACGFSGIVIQAGATLVVDIKSIEKLTDQYNMFFVSVKV
jgi:DUF1009 family protein